MCCPERCRLFFFFNDTATTEIYTLSIHDALPIFVRLLPTPARRDSRRGSAPPRLTSMRAGAAASRRRGDAASRRSEEHTSELQSRSDLVCRLLLEKKTLEWNHSVSYFTTDSHRHR